MRGRCWSSVVWIGRVESCKRAPTSGCTAPSAEGPVGSKTTMHILLIRQSFVLKLKLKGISLSLLYFLASSEFLWGVWALPTCIISTSRLPNMVGGLLWGALTWTLRWTGGLIWHMGCSSRADSIYSSVHLKRSRWSTFIGVREIYATNG